MTDENKPPHPMSRRFRGFLPVVVDVETAGFNPERDALLGLEALNLRLASRRLLELSLRDETGCAQLLCVVGGEL